ncbi:MAG: MotA/TolQ/ExbB proton channel family protein [Defluviitaleaceae bacterium]|nr:MotA/TolQ/ExbB proton channel family protein [Defluviitaleaceae bacterium]
MDIASLLGLISGIIFIILAILFSSGYDFAAIGAFGDPGSVMVVIGGTVASVFIAQPLSRVLGAIGAVKFVFMPPKFDHGEAISRIITLSNLARREGVLALEASAQNMDDPFLKKGVMLIVDGGEPELVRSVLETEMSFVENRHNDLRAVWDMVASFAPAWGMVGTMVALVLMMQNLSDAEALAQGMALAMITTFYGAIMANFFAIPFSKKLGVYNSEEMLLKEILLEGMLSIQAGENPRIIEEKLKAFLSPKLRVEEAGGSGGES